MEINIAVIADSPELHLSAKAFSEKHGLELCQEDELGSYEYALHFSLEGVYLSWLPATKRSTKKSVTLAVDFASGRAAHRRRFGGGKGQLIAKAVGLQSKRKNISVLDCTAGQGGDAFVLASLGCDVTMIERSFIAHVLLASGLEQARVKASNDSDDELIAVLERMVLLHGDAKQVMSAKAQQFDVVYLDPMFPERKKSALVKKEMQCFHQIIGKDLDADLLLQQAQATAKYRTVVKRPKNAPHLNDEAPTYTLEGKSTRFDIYVNQSIDTES